jgi:hypothetical protein
MNFRPTCRCDASALSDFLGQRFHVAADPSFLDERHMEWKYWTARPDWAGSRGFVARHAGAIIAHAATWPVRVHVPDDAIPAVHVIDWAAHPQYPGAGLWLLRQIEAQGRLMIATGGTDITRRILPVIGFRPYGEVCSFARSVRPLRQAWATVEKDWRLPGRVLRNSYWRMRPALSAPPGWSVRPVSPADISDDAWPRPSAAMAVTARDSGFYDYFAECPRPRHVLLGLEARGGSMGYCCVAWARHVARVADLWLPSTSVRDWCAAFQTAAVFAARDREIHEVTAWASSATAKAALNLAGFRLRERSAISVLGDTRALEGRELHLQMVDTDSSFLRPEAVSYLT